MSINRRSLSFFSLVSCLGLVAMLISPAVAPIQIDIPGPEGSGLFGSSVTVLSNGNIVIIDPNYDDGVNAQVGAVYLYNGASGELISMLTGSSGGDRVGAYGVTELADGNYVVKSPYWDNGTAADAGAATWGDGTTGVAGVVSPDNSLVGSSSEDQVGSGVTALANGNYVVSSYYWDNGMATDAGSVTWGDGSIGITGTVSADNSLVGSTAGDYVANAWLTALENGNYVVISYLWDNGMAADAGAVTWGDGTTGITGTVSIANSLVGSTSEDWVGSSGVTALENGSYVVSSPHWDNGTILDAGAATWGYVTTITTGPITADNSVRGTTENGGESMNFEYDEVNHQLVVGRREDNIVTLYRPNRMPLADAGSDQNVLSSSTVTLDGSGSDDPDGDLPLAFDWEQSGGTPVTLSSSTAISPTFTAPAVITQTSVLTFTLVVSDALGLTSLPDQVVIAVEPYPVADAGPDQSVLSHASVTLDGSASDDPNGDLPLAFDWEQSGGTPVSLNGSTTANPTFTAPTVLETSTLTFTLVVSDSLGYASLPDKVVITVEPVPVADAGPDQSVLSSSTVTLDGSDSYDPDGDLPLAFDWEQSSGTPVTLSGSDTANPSFTTPSVSQTIVLTFRLVVSDALGIPSLPDEVVITVEPYPVESYLMLLPVVTNRESP